MGREAVAICQWRGEQTEAKVEIDADGVTVRSAIRLRLGRSMITGVSVDGDDLLVMAGEGRLILSLGANEAEKWQTRLLSPVPTLAEKLGLAKGGKAFVVGHVIDTELQAALNGATTDAQGEATMIIAVVQTEAELAQALDSALISPQLHCWCVNAKGKQAAVSDGVVRATMRANGLIDSKTCRVSEQMSATRYRIAGP